MNPIHTGHIDYMEAAKALGNYLIVIVNNDKQVKLKGSTPFMSEDDRLRIVESIGCVDKAMISIDTDSSVVSSLQLIHGRYSLDVFVDSITFVNGGDRTSGNSPEETYCKEAGIRTAYGVGGGKTRSSSKLIKGTEKSTGLLQRQLFNEDF
jgi:cytidyltransferase-like protein